MTHKEMREILLNKGYRIGSEYKQEDETVRGFVEAPKEKWRLYGTYHACAKNFALAQDKAIEDAIKQAMSKLID